MAKLEGNGAETQETFKVPGAQPDDLGTQPAEDKGAEKVEVKADADSVKSEDPATDELVLEKPKYIVVVSTQLYFDARGVRYRAGTPFKIPAGTKLTSSMRLYDPAVDANKVSGKNKPVPISSLYREGTVPGSEDGY